MTTGEQESLNYPLHWLGIEGGEEEGGEGEGREGGSGRGRKGGEGGTDHRVCLTATRQEYGCARPRPRTNSYTIAYMPRETMLN